MERIPSNQLENNREYLVWLPFSGCWAVLYYSDSDNDGGEWEPAWSDRGNGDYVCVADAGHAYMGPLPDDGPET